MSTLGPTLGFPIPLTLRWIGFVVGVILIIWPLLKAVYKRIRQITVGPQHLIIVGTIGAVLFAAVLGTGVIWQQLKEPPNNPAAMRWTDDPAPVFEGTPLAWNKQPYLGWQKRTEDQIDARTITVEGKNIGKEEIQLDDVYLISGVTGKRIDMMIEAADGRMAIMVPAKNTNPIPPGALIRARTGELNGVAGIAEADFIKDWGTIYFIADYNGEKHRIEFDRKTITSLFDAQRPKPVPPYVTVRK